MRQLRRACALAWVFAVGVSDAAAATPPQRIVSLNLCTDQILLQVVPRERIAALGWLSQSPESAALHREAKGLRTVRGSAEEVLALQPDLVLVGTATTRFTTRLLRDYGIPVLALRGAESFADVREQIRSVANAVGEVARGEAVIAAMEERGRRIAAERLPVSFAAPAPAPAQPIALVTAQPGIAMLYGAGGRSAGAGTLYDDILQAGGYANGAAKAGLKGYGALPLERVVAQNPQVLLSSDYKRGTATLGNRLLKHPALNGLGAKEVTLPSPWMICGGPWNLDAAQMLAARGAPAPAATAASP